MRFNLIRYFTVASAVAFALVAAAMIHFERDETGSFTRLQDQQLQVFEQTQRDFAKHQEEVSRRDLLAIQESGNVNLTRLFANALWDRDFAPFVAVASRISAEACRQIPDLVDDKTGTVSAPPEKKACFAELGRKIAALPGFARLDAKVYDTMRRTNVFKIKVFDLRGITVYSSEHAQIGEDKAQNAGWLKAVSGTPASELTHRDKFSAFEGVVEDRDVISSYLPVREPGSDEIVGVFEVYSDVTQFLSQIRHTGQTIRQDSERTLAQVKAAAVVNQEEVERSSRNSIVIVSGLLLVLFGTLFVAVKRADRLIERQEEDREFARQQMIQSEKMATLGQMVAGVAHQLNTPLAFSQSNVTLVIQSLDSLVMPLKAAGKLVEVIRRAEGDTMVLDIAKAKRAIGQLDNDSFDVTTVKQMLGDVLQGIGQMTDLVVNLRDFTRLDRAKVADADINKALHTVVYIARSVIGESIHIEENFSPLPTVKCNISQLNQVFLNLINNAAQAIGANTGTIRVRTNFQAGRIHIEVGDDGPGIPPEVLPHIFERFYTTKEAGEGTGLGLPIARDILEQHGGDLSVSTEVGVGTTFLVTLPLYPRVGEAE